MPLPEFLERFLAYNVQLPFLDQSSQNESDPVNIFPKQQAVLEIALMIA